MHLAKIIGVRCLGYLVGAVDLLCFTGVLSVLGVRILNYVQHEEQFGLLAPVARFAKAAEKPAIAFLHAHVPCTIKGFDLAPFMIAGTLLAICMLCDNLLHRIRVWRLRLEELRKISEKEEALSADDVAGRLAAVSAVDPSKRDKVLEIYAKTKKILEEQRKTLTFLSIDVVDSTGMKHGEDPALAELDFRHYRKLVEGAIESHKALKAAWTPDGVMICFTALEDAVGAAQGLIKGLEAFNRDVKTIKADFRIRCGVNSGEVLFDDTVKMEEMSDGSIDLAGHMQKYAAPNSIYAAKSLVDAHGAKLGFRPADKKVDGVDVCEWRPQVAHSKTA